MPARVAGTWRLGSADLTLTQEFQMITGTLAATPITGGRLIGEQILFRAGDTDYAGRVTGDRIEGTASTNGKQQNWSATKQVPAAP